MRKVELYLISLKKEILDFLYNKVSILLFILAACFLLFLERIPSFYDIVEDSPSKLYIIFDFVISIFLITQFLYDGFKKDFTRGGVIFLLNCNIPCNIYLFGKKIISIILTLVLILFRVQDLVSIFSCTDYIWIFLFFVFIINNTFLFSILFYSPNMNLIAYSLIFVFPAILLVLLLSFKLNILKGCILLVINLFIKQSINKAWYSRRFRLNLKTI